MFVIKIARIWLIKSFVIGFVLSVYAVSIQAQSSIRKVDFKNFSYRLSCGSADRKSTVKVRNGKYDGRKGSLNTDVFLNIYKVLYGDLDGDQKDEAVVFYMCGSGASYAYFRGLVYSLKNRKPTLMTELEGGNKGDGGFNDVWIVNGRLVVERNQVGVGGSACCPESIEITRYKLKGKHLVRSGKRQSRKITTNSQ